VGLSTADDEVGRQVLAIPAFRALDGSFDREAYRFALDRTGLTQRQFEEQVRREATREIVATALRAPATMPAVAGRTVLDFLGERRVLSYLSLGPEHLDAALPEPTDEALREFHAADPERYTRPERREITVAIARLEDIAAGIEVSDAAIDAALESQAGRFQTPERRYVDRIGFNTREAAEAARQRIDSGETTFDAVAAERELTSRDIDQGLLAATDLAPGAREAVFGLGEPGIAGPVDTPLGPALYRVNGIIGGGSVPAEEARALIRDELALAAARDRILDVAAELEDLVAGGATIEEIAEETPLIREQVVLDEGETSGLAADPAFREAAFSAAEGFVSDPFELEDGSVVTLRVDAIVPPALTPLEDVRARVAADWTAAQAESRLAEISEGFRVEVAEGLPLETVAERLGAAVETAGPVSRGEIAEDAAPELVAEIFAVEPGQAVVLPQPGGAILARLDRIEPFDPAANATVVASVEAELTRQIGEDMLAYTTRAIQAEAGVTVNESLVQSTIAALP
jgi:peptidyl-prolyl cis-trans isomerase D